MLIHNNDLPSVIDNIHHLFDLKKKKGSAGIKRTILLGGLFETLIDPTSPNSGIEPGARMAIDAVNADLNILPNYKLTLASMETGCSPETSLLSYFKFYEDRGQSLAGNFPFHSRFVWYHCVNVVSKTGFYKNWMQSRDISPVLLQVL